MVGTPLPVYEHGVEGLKKWCGDNKVGGPFLKARPAGGVECSVVIKSETLLDRLVECGILPYCAPIDLGLVKSKEKRTVYNKSVYEYLQNEDHLKDWLERVFDGVDFKDKDQVTLVVYTEDEGEADDDEVKRKAAKQMLVRLWARLTYDRSMLGLLQFLNDMAGSEDAKVRDFKRKEYTIKGSSREAGARDKMGEDRWHSSVQATYNGAEGNSTIALSEPVHRDGTLEVTLELFPGDNMTHKQDIRMLLPYFGVKVTTNKPESHVPLRRAGPSDVQERLAEAESDLDIDSDYADDEGINVEWGPLPIDVHITIDTIISDNCSMPVQIRKRYSGNKIEYQVQFVKKEKEAGALAIGEWRSSRRRAFTACRKKFLAEMERRNTSFTASKSKKVKGA